MILPSPLAFRCTGYCREPCKQTKRTAEGGPDSLHALVQRFNIPLFSREWDPGVLVDAVQRHLEKHTRAQSSLNPYFFLFLFSLLASEGRCRAAVLISFLFLLHAFVYLLIVWFFFGFFLSSG